MSVPGSNGGDDRSTWTGWGKGKYNDTYNSCAFSSPPPFRSLHCPADSCSVPPDVPWLEDKYLAWFGENKTSYMAKENLKTRVVPDENVGKVQDGVAEGVGGQLSSGGLLGKVGDASSKEGVNRAERGETGVDDQGAAQGVSGKMQQGAEGVTGTVGKGVSGLTGGLTGGGEKK